MIKTKLPSIREIVPVISTIVFINFSWSIYRMFWFMPSWLLYLKTMDIINIAAYVMAFSLFESALILGLLLALVILLPAQYYRVRFTPRSILMVGIFALAAFLVRINIKLVYKWSPQQITTYSYLTLAVVIILSLIVSYLLIPRFTPLENIITTFADRIDVFSYLYVPLGVLGLIIVLIRNLL